MGFVLDIEKTQSKLLTIYVKSKLITKIKLNIKYSERYPEREITLRVSGDLMRKIDRKVWGEESNTTIPKMREYSPIGTNLISFISSPYWENNAFFFSLVLLCFLIFITRNGLTFNKAVWHVTITISFSPKYIFTLTLSKSHFLILSQCSYNPISILIY